MTFYETLYPFYDRIFPLNKQSESFLEAHFNKGQSLLDVGAGTGNMAIALAEKGFIVTAVEPEEKMANDIIVKASSKDISVKVHTYTMEQIEQLGENFDGIYCVGNTLPHLQSIEEIKSFLEKCYKKLTDGGQLILQTVNFEKFISSLDFSFPIIEKEEFKFERNYEQQDEKVIFTTTLTTKKGAFTNSIPLYPVTSNEIVPSLEQIGYNKIEVLGNFKGEPYSVGSPAFIVVATK